MRRARGFDTIGKEAFQRYGAVPLTGSGAGPGTERMTALETVHAIEFRHITKRFGKVVANDGIDLTLDRGEILALLGENGSGKTTLMNMLSGIYFPDEGEILVGGKPAAIRSPKDAYANGIGMIHQHYKLVDVFTAAENIALGLHDGGRLNIEFIDNEMLWSRTDGWMQRPSEMPRHCWRGPSRCPSWTSSTTFIS